MSDNETSGCLCGCEGERKVELRITVDADRQGLVYFPGDGTATELNDSVDSATLIEAFPAPVARAVFAARLRAFADMLDAPNVDLAQFDKAIAADRECIRVIGPDNPDLVALIEERIARTERMRASLGRQR